VAKAWLHAPWQRERDREETPLAAGFRVGAETEAAATVVVAAAGDGGGGEGGGGEGGGGDGGDYMYEIRSRTCKRAGRILHHLM